MKAVTAILVAGLFFAGAPAISASIPLGLACRAWRAGPGQHRLQWPRPDWFVHRLSGRPRTDSETRRCLSTGVAICILQSPLNHWRGFHSDVLSFRWPRPFGCPRAGLRASIPSVSARRHRADHCRLGGSGDTGLRALPPDSEVERDVHEAMLAVLSAKIVEAVVPSAAGRAEDFSRDP